MTNPVKNVVLTIAAAAVLATGSIAAAMPAAAQPAIHGTHHRGGDWRMHGRGLHGGYGRGYYGGRGWDDGDAVGAGILGFMAGAFVNEAFSHANPVSCSARFKTYKPATGTYTGYDGLEHPCP